MKIKFKNKCCPMCDFYLPKSGASSHKCLFKGVVFIGESDTKCKHYSCDPLIKPLRMEAK